MFERFTTDARQTVVFAQEEARRLHHPRVGTEPLDNAMRIGAAAAAFWALVLSAGLRTERGS